LVYESNPFSRCPGKRAGADDTNGGEKNWISSQGSGRRFFNFSSDFPKNEARKPMGISEGSNEKGVA